MSDLVGDVEAFHAKFGLTYDGAPRVLFGELGEFRRKFLGEELSEYEKAMYQGQYAVAMAEALPDDHPAGDTAAHLEHMLDALVDLVYVAIGTAQMQGLDFREAWRRVHEANMAKVRAERASDSARGTTFDVVKPPGWRAPSHRDLVERHAHRRES